VWSSRTSSTGFTTLLPRRAARAPLPPRPRTAPVLTGRDKGRDGGWIVKVCMNSYLALYDFLSNIYMKGETAGTTPQVEATKRIINESRTFESMK
jgi:hypothetical protein